MSDFSRLKIRQTEIVHFYEEIKDRNAWKYGYVTKTNCRYFGVCAEKYEEYDYATAVCHYILSTLRFIEHEHWTAVAPTPMILPIRNGITPSTIDRHFNM